MHFRALISLALAVSAAASTAVAQQRGLSDVWSLGGFSAPESALFDPLRGEIYVSNVVGDPLAADGLGFISRAFPDGKMLEAEWVSGFDAPKGLALNKGTLYVADIGELVAIDTATGEITGRWAAREGDLLNDITVDAEGRLFVSGTLGNRIYLLENDALTVWLEDPALNRPNGLKAHEDSILVASWGEMPGESDDPQPGSLSKIDVGTKEVTAFGEGEPTGNLDGIEPDGKGGWLISEFTGGGLFHIDATGEVQLLQTTPQGSADLGFISDDGLVLLPVMLRDTLVAYKIQ